MYSLLLAATLATAPIAAPPPAPAPAVPAASIDTTFTRASDSAGTTAGGLALPAAALAALAAVGILLARRRSQAPRLVQLVETAGLGGKRSLVVARIGPELLLLGVSEAGVALLGTRPAPPSPQPASEGAPGSRLGAAAAYFPAQSARPTGPGRIAGLLSRLRPRPAVAPAPPFDACLAECTEDQELRRKLARGLAGSVR